MNWKLSYFLAGVLGAASLFVAPSSGAGGAGPAGSQPATTTAADKAYVPRDTRKHDAFVKIAKAGGIDLLFVGDSITEMWASHGKKVWAKEYAPLKSANFGIGGDAVKGVLWRMQNGELEGIHPKLVVLMIGTNNNEDTPEFIAEHIQLIIGEIQKRSPGTRILLLGILPKGPKDGRARTKSAAVNKILATYAQPDDPKRVVYMEFGEKYLNPDRSINKTLMPDTLHPSEAGYQVWADVIRDTVKQLMQEDTKPATTQAAPKGNAS